MSTRHNPQTVARRPGTYATAAGAPTPQVAPGRPQPANPPAAVEAPTSQGVWINEHGRQTVRARQPQAAAPAVIRPPSVARRRETAPVPAPVQTPAAAPAIAQSFRATAMPMTERVDPFWDNAFHLGEQSVEWLNGPALKHYRDARPDLWKIRSSLDMQDDYALRAATAGRNRQGVVAVLSALHSWRTLTAQQLACLVGDPALTSARNVVIKSLWNLGVIEIGQRALRGLGHRLDDGLWLRIGHRDAIKILRPHLTWHDWMTITGGQRWEKSKPRVRHDTYAMECALRLADHADVLTVLGEKFSTADMLGGTGAGRAPLTIDSSADFTVVRPDGMKIAVELTSSVTPNLAAKAAKWARAIALSPFEATGLFVVFLIVGKPDDTRVAKEIRSVVRDAIATAARSYPGTVRDRVAERIGFATWSDWFPEKHVISPAGLAMRTLLPTGRGERLWEPVDMLNPTQRPFTPKDPTAVVQVKELASLLGQTPAWLRVEKPSHSFEDLFWPPAPDWVPRRSA